MARITDEHGVGGGRAQPLERLQYRLRVRLGVRNVVGADDHLEAVFEPGDLEPAKGALPYLARHEPQRLSVLPEIPHRGDDALVRPHQLVVVLEVVGAVRGHHGLDLGGILGPVVELHPERRPEALHPHLVRRLEPAMGAHGVPVRSQDQLDRVDECAVEVEEKRGEHAGS